MCVETQSAVGFRHHVTNHLSKHAGTARPTKPDPAKNRARQSHLSSCTFADAEGGKTGGKSHDQQVEALWLRWCIHWSASSHPWSGSHTCNQTQRGPEKSRQIVGPWQETGKSTPNHPNSETSSHAKGPISRQWQLGVHFQLITSDLFHIFRHKKDLSQINPCHPCCFVLFFQFVQMKQLLADDKCHFMAVNITNVPVWLSCGSTGAGLFGSDRVSSKTRKRTPSVELLRHSLRATMEVMSCKLWWCSVPAGAHFASN